MFGCSPSEADLRYAQGLINTFCNRPSLGPVEVETGTIQIPSDRQETRLPLTPVVRILSAAGRYGRGRRDRLGYNNILYNYGATLLALQGAVPQWIPIAPELISLDPATGVLYLPTGTFLWSYIGFRAVYIAGYVEIPYRVKLAMITLVNEVHAKGISDRVKFTAGRVSRTWAGDTFVSKQVQNMLQPFVITEYM